jgi:putative ABC transport system permease protein
MFQNAFKTTLRNLGKHKGYSFLNIAGLSVGLAMFILILLFVGYEFRYEKHHQNAERIYRLVIEQNLGDRVFTASSSPVPLAEALKRELPEVEEFARFFSWGQALVANGERRFNEEGFSFADPGALTMFTYPMLKGIPANALTADSSAVITSSIAKKYFGDEDPIGQTLSIDWIDAFDVTVTGVIADHPPTTDFAPEILVSMGTLVPLVADGSFGGGFFNNWASQMLRAYILLPERHDVREMETKVMSVFRPHLTEGDRRVVKLERLADAHLHPLASGGTGDIRTLRIFLACGILVLLTACINFMNLATARSARRAKEVGLRKVVGAARSQLIRQFIGESLLYAVFSLVLGLGIAIPGVPLLNQLTGQFVNVSDLGRGGIVPLILGVTALTGLVSGSYPALYLSGLKPVRVLKGTLKDRGSKGSLFRKILVVAQFTISIILIISTMIFGRQLRYVHDKPLGFDKDQILVLQTNSGPVVGDLGPLKTALLQDPRILGVTGSEHLPSSIRQYNNITWEGAAPGEKIEIMGSRIDYDFLDTYGIELAAGRNFSLEFLGDLRTGDDPQSPRGVLLNEEAVRRMGWSDPIGKQVVHVWGDNRAYWTVVGVVKDFHFTSLRSAIRPLNFFLSTGINRYVSIKLGGQDLPGTLGFVEATWKRLYPELPFDFYFLDNVFDRLYRSEARQRQLFGALSGLAVFIACLGLFGLAAYAAEQRTKEIGIRKVLGASTPGIVRLLSGEFTRLVLAANLLAWPVAYLAMNRWLGGFAYRIELTSQLGWFLLAGVLSVVVAWLTVGFQSVKAAMADPVRSLRYE